MQPNSDVAYAIASMITQNTPWLEEMEAELRKKNLPQAADNLAKFIQDAGVEMDPFPGAYMPDDVQLTGAKLHAAYEPITLERSYRVLDEAYVSLPHLSPLRVELRKLIRPLKAALNAGTRGR